MPLSDRTHSEKRVVGQFHPCVNNTECTYTNLHGTACYTLRPDGLAYSR